MQRAPDGTFLRLPMGILLFIESFFMRRILGAAGGAKTACCAGSLLRWEKPRQFLASDRYDLFPPYNRKQAERLWALCLFFVCVQG